MVTDPWWKRALGWSAEQPQPPAAAPARQRIIVIPGQLAVTIHSHEVQSQAGAVPCWTYVTEGLSKHRQAEMVFTLVRRSGDAGFPQEPLQFFQTIDHVARAGNFVTAGGFTQFGARKFLGRNVAYIPAQPLPGVEIPPFAIGAILVTDEEVTALQELGVTRLMSRLGKLARYYPCPPWSDPQRPGLEFSKQPTALAQVARMRPPGCHVYQTGERVVLALAKGTGDQAASCLATLPAKAAVALLTELDERADGCLVWEPGQTEREAISPPGSTGQRICGCFLMLVSGQAEEKVTILEDGFAALLTTASWQALLNALRKEQGLLITTPVGGLPLSIQWYSHAYENPIDGKTYVADGGWQSHPPDSNSKSDALQKKVVVDHVRLLTAEAQIADRTTVEQLARFIKQLEERAISVLDKCDRACELLLQIRCLPEGHDVLAIKNQGEVPRELTEELTGALKQIEMLPVSKQEVLFQMALKVTP